MAKKKAAPVNNPAPLLLQSPEDVEHFIRDIGTNQRHLMTLRTEMGGQIAEIEKKYADELALTRQVIDEKAEAVQLWCEAFRPLITNQGELKTVKFSAGRVSWRTTPPSVEFKSGMNTEKVLDFLKKRDLQKFIRTAETVNKEALLEDANFVRSALAPTIRIKQEEIFSITPVETDIDILKVRVVVSKEQP